MIRERNKKEVCICREATITVRIGGYKGLVEDGKVGKRISLNQQEDICGRRRGLGVGRGEGGIYEARQKKGGANNARTRGRREPERSKGNGIGVSTNGGGAPLG